MPICKTCNDGFTCSSCDADKYFILKENNMCYCMDGFILKGIEC